jgi:lipopolysaccharide export system protein LptA
MNVIMVVKSFLPARRWIGGGLSLLAIGVAGAAIAQSSMSGVPNAMQGFSQNRDQPIQIEAASLEVRDKQKEATFTGDVKVVQGDTTMKSKSLVVFYDGGDSAKQPGGGTAPAKGADKNQIKAAQPGPGGSSSIRRLEARGNVVVKQRFSTPARIW